MRRPLWFQCGEEIVKKAGQIEGLSMDVANVQARDYRKRNKVAGRGGEEKGKETC